MQALHPQPSSLTEIECDGSVLQAGGSRLLTTAQAG